MIVHQTKTNRIFTAEIEGWEFSCHLCGYKAQYITNAGEHILEVLSAGDPHVRHMSSPVYDMARDDGMAWSAEPYTVDEDLPDSDDEVWLPPQIEQQLIEILSRFDGGEG